MSALWSIFATAVHKAVDDRNDERRRTRALERIAAALEEHNNLTLDGYGGPYVTPPPQGAK